MRKFNPAYSLARTILNLGLGKISFLKNDKGIVLKMEDGELFKVFSHVIF